MVWRTKDEGQMGACRLAGFGCGGCELSWDGPVPRDVGFNFGQRVGNVDFCLGLQKAAVSAQKSCG